MKYSFLALLMVVLSSCQTTKIKNETYKISKTSPELGSIGQSDLHTDLQNTFQVKSFPKLENKIRVAIEIVPFNKKLNKIYTEKAKYNQNQPKVVYVDSLPIKPELAIIKLMDVTGFVNELNADYNQDVYRTINDLQNLKIVSSVAIYLSSEDNNKIKQADSYYLTNSQDKKYGLTLYKQGKKTEAIDVNLGTIVAYNLSSFCWAETNRAKWYIADIVNDNSSCAGTTLRTVKEKRKEKSLFKM